MKEILLLLSILIIIIGSAIFIQNYLSKTTENLIISLNHLKEKVLENVTNINIEEINLLTNELYKNWGKTEKIWFTFILHSELDSIETSLIKMKSNIKQNNINMALENIETSIFLIKNINEKEKFCIENIF